MTSQMPAPMGRRYSRLPIDTPARRDLVMFANTTFNVLIADDHPLVVTGVESALRDLRSLRIVGTAGNSTQIVERLGREACDLLITDFVMPDGRYNDGLTMLTYIRSHFPDLPVIVFTAVDGIALTGELTRLGVKAIVNKADDVGHLISAIYAVHAGSEYLSPSVSRANPRLRGTAILATLKAEFSTLEEFEREFPSLCFALATGVGKTRLMGAFIAYLHLAHDGFVKEPAVVTQRNFDAKAHTPEEIEKTKLEDGVRLHETTKVELLTYARENGVKVVKPFMLVIARDTTHAGQLLALLESEAFYEGRYQGKVIQVDSSRTGAEEEEMITRLLAVESVDEPTEIVIHVNMLKEGWDVTNLYTIVPLRAANARTLIEQSIGRGLRLPYGKRTGVASVDRLNIVAHDKFQEIIDEANRGDSPIRLKQVILDAPSADDKKVSVQVGSGAMTRLGLTDTPVVTVAPAGNGATAGTAPAAPAPAPVFTTDVEKQAARVVMDVIGKLEAKRDLVPTSSALLKPEVQKEILAEVAERLKPMQGNLLAGVDEGGPALDLSAVVAKTTEIVVQQTIDIPRIAVVPTGEVTTGFHPFKLDVSQLHLQPGEREIVIHNLRTNEQDTLAAEIGLKEQRPEDYVVHALVDFDDIDYFTHADLLYDLASQMVQHLQGYLSEDEARSVLDRDRRLIAREIHAQMMAHFWEEATEYEVQVSRGFTELKPCNYTATAGQTAQHFRETVTETSRIKQMLFGGFARCLYPLQKFDSDTERRFAIILERDASKWFKPAKGQFQIYYKLGTEQPEYIPDFVAETDSTIFMVETKARTDINTQEVQAKAAAAARWCKHASDHAAGVGTKPWKYLLVPHDEITESKRLSDFLRFEVK
ncbi:response regulator [Burkholderia sp. Cy-647]|nr:response regulator [Burkholderia sp. Tr-860]NIF63647.1 response regulator [Burkholderia sp. Cy-647]NIF99088.1 response regulator [Burkholderia sp. Ax-1720]